MQGAPECWMRPQDGERRVRLRAARQGGLSAASFTATATADCLAGVSPRPQPWPFRWSDGAGRSSGSSIL